MHSTWHWRWLVQYLNIDSEGWQSTDHEHEFTPDQEDADGGRVVLPLVDQDGELVEAEGRIPVKGDQDHVDDYSELRQRKSRK